MKKNPVKFLDADTGKDQQQVDQLFFLEQLNFKLFLA